ncbi:hypothetical protein ABZ778_31590 [Streptomyces bacillaris]|uniref:hypothetical protein n=1 Tax=Streptomyces bacillaris TaxID=68179 RepID=UPI0034613B77
MQTNVTEIRRGDRFSDARGTYIAIGAATPTGPDREGNPRVNIICVKDEGDTVGPDGLMHLDRSARAIQRRTDRTVEIQDREIPITHKMDRLPEYTDEVDLGSTDREKDANLLRIRIPQVVRILEEQGSERDLLIRKGLHAGIPVIELAELSGLSRARIYQIRDGRR